ncbi:MAG: FmdB family zinc ribbon protein [Solirubrobacteraceae bacterium]
MPLYDFACRDCGARFEERVSFGQLPPCSECGSPDSERVLSPFAGPFTVGLRGYTARRSNAVRSQREEQRRERRSERDA